MRPGTPGFVGQRLREARLARDMTAANLAAVVDLSGSSISAYEHNKQSPGPETAEKLAKALNVPTRYFTTPLEPHEIQELDTAHLKFFRSQASATKRARQRAEARNAWVRKIVQHQEGYVQFTRPNFPVFETPKDPMAFTRERIEDLATRTRRFWGLGDGPISNVVRLLENNGAIITRFAFEAPKLDAFSEWPQASERPFIVLNADKTSAARGRFDAAHELAHLILHRNIDRRHLKDKATFKEIEKQAHYFAALFLFPRESFIREIRIPSLDAMVVKKRHWKLSINMMVVLSFRLNLISQERYIQLQRNLSRRQWRTKEPLDDILPIEEPMALRKSIELVLDHGLFSREQLLGALPISRQDIEELAGLPQGYLDTEEHFERIVELKVPGRDAGADGRRQAPTATGESTSNTAKKPLATVFTFPGRLTST